MIPLALLLGTLARAEDTALVHLLTEQLQTQQAELSLPEAPPTYYLRYRLSQLQQRSVIASFGGLLLDDPTQHNTLSVALRVGTPQFDQTGFGGWQNGFTSTSLPEELTPEGLALAAWRLTDLAYKQAVEQHARKVAQFSAPPDYPGDFQEMPPVQAQPPAPPAPTEVDLAGLARELSSAFVGGQVLARGDVYVGHEVGPVWLVDTEGSQVGTLHAETTLRAAAHLRAADGMLLTDQLLWTVTDPAALPPAHEMKNQVTQLRQGLQALAAAPVFEEEYVGPVIFEDSAATDLYRYLLMNQLEGTPAEIPFDSFFGDLGSQKDPVRLGRRVLPPGWIVVDDPTALPSHPGSYTFDGEGRPAQAVQLVEGGIVRDLLMSRTPRRGAHGSNGHAQPRAWSRAEARVSLTTVTPPHNGTTAKLHRKALKLAQAYGLDHIMVVRRLQEPAVQGIGQSAGFFSFTREDLGTVLPAPVAVYKVYTDGHEEPFRGARFAGVQRWLLRDIQAVGPQVQSSYLAPFNGDYTGLDPTEGAPSWISAPEVLVGELELVGTSGDPRDAPVLPAPE